MYHIKSEQAKDDYAHVSFDKQWFSRALRSRSTFAIPLMWALLCAKGRLRTILLGMTATHR